MNTRRELPRDLLLSPVTHASLLERRLVGSVTLPRPRFGTPQAILPIMSILQCLYDLDESSAQLPDQLDELLRDGEYVDRLLGLPRPELVQAVNHLDNVRLTFGMEVRLITFTDPSSP